MEVIENKLYLYLESSWDDGSHTELKGDMTVNLDNIYQHNKVRKHFGPPSLKVIWKHCEEVDLRISKCCRLIFLTNDLNDNLHIERRTISAFLMAAFAVLRLGWDAHTANEELLQKLPARLAFFRDYHGDSNYKLNILDCLRGLQTGCKVNKWFCSFASTKFPQATNSHLDMNWIVPQQFLAFKDPTINKEKDNRGVSKAVIKELKRCGIKAVVRLNGNDHVTNMEYYGNSYRVSDIKQENFFHFEIPFKDVSIPTMAQAKQFVRTCERFGGKIAVHCHAGLGRTATMLGCHLIKNYNFDARSVCGWLKMCRRGSVMGPQHFFMDQYEKDLKNIEKSSETSRIMTVHQLEVPLENTVIKVHVPVVQPSETHTSSPVRISRTPRKNNIIHVAPVKKRIPDKPNPMQKYKLETKPVVRPDSKRHKIITPQPDLVVKPAHSANPPKEKLKQHRPTTVKKSATASGRFMVEPPSTKKPRKQLTKSTIPRRRKCVVNSAELSFNPTKAVRTKSQLQRSIPHDTRVMNKRVTKSHDAMSSRRSISANKTIIAGSSSWSQWSGNVIDGLVTHSKSRIYGLINGVYSKNSLQK